jgi:hypothetical protein
VAKSEEVDPGKSEVDTLSQTRYLDCFADVLPHCGDCGCLYPSHTAY